jgi:hypothetical protein
MTAFLVSKKKECRFSQLLLALQESGDLNKVQCHIMRNNKRWSVFRITFVAMFEVEILDSLLQQRCGGKRKPNDDLGLICVIEDDVFLVESCHLIRKVVFDQL